MSASWALFSDASLTGIQAAAFWSTSITFISFFLKDVVQGETAFASAVFRAAPQTSSV